jgi:hypothetical protein
MTDYNKLTVANLRQVLKERGIPSTGLTRKAQIIEKLEEADKVETAAASSAEPAQSTSVESQEDNGGGNAEKAADVTETTAPTEPAPVTEDAPATHPAEPVPEHSYAPQPAAPAPTEPVVDTTPAEAQEQPPTISAPVNEDVSVSPTPVDVQPVVEAPEQVTHASAPAEEPAGQAAEAFEASEQLLEVTEQSAAATGPITEVTKQPAAATEHPVEATEQPVAVTEPSAEPEDTAMDESPSTPPHDPNESQSVEDPVPAPIDESPAPAAPSSIPEEVDSETKKRKRRSQSPDIPAEVIAKKAKASVEFAGGVHLKEDEDTVMMEKAADRAGDQELVLTEKPADKEGAGQDDLLKEEKPTDREEEAQKVVLPKATPTEPRADREAKSAAEAERFRRPSVTPAAEESRPEKREKDSRYRSLFQAQSSSQKPSGPDLLSSEDRPIPPALHPATPAIYIRNFMRPLRYDGLRTHLISLASPPSSSPDPSILKTLFLDNMRTHALALFTNTSAAARVRASLHGSIWPHERDRKELWVDFVPEDKVETWIAAEESEEQESREKGRRPNMAKKFEVVYRDDDADGTMIAIFQPVDGHNGNRRTAPPPLGPSNTNTNNFNPRAPPSAKPAPPPATPTINTEKPFATLSTLFDSTTSKPKIYYLPVSPSLAAARLDELDKETSRDWSPDLQVKGRGRGYLD